MTLIAYYTSDGCEGRCDAKCYEAHEPVCECICGGMNHGVGRQMAMDNTRAYAEQMMKDYTEKNNLQGVTWQIPAAQLTLPL